MVKRHIVGSPRGNLSLYRIRGVPYRYSASKRRSDGDAGPGTVYPIFQLGESPNINPSVGVGPATFTRASESMVVDYEGGHRKVPINCALRKGARYVKNLLIDDVLNALSEDAQTGNPGLINLASATAPDVVESTGVDWYWYRSLNINGQDFSGKTVVFRLKVEDMGGMAQFGMRMSGSHGGFDAAFLAVTGPGEYALINTFTSSSGPGLEIGLEGRSFASGDGVSFGPAKITHWQVEDITGQSNQNPGEYVSVGVLSAPYHGLGADGIKAFDTLNGNTVDGNGVVTEAPGAAISPAPVWEHQPGSKNKCGNYNIAPNNLIGVILNQSGTGATCTVEDNAEVLAAIPNGNGKVYDLDTTAATAGAWVAITGTVGNLNPHTLSVWAKLISGSAALKLEGAAQSTAITEQEWTRVLSPNVVPDTTGRRLIVNAIGTTTRVLFIANQLEEKPVATALIPVAIVAASRAQPEWKYPRVGNVDETEGMLVLEGCVPEVDPTDLPNSTNLPYLSLLDSSQNLLFGFRGTSPVIAYSYDGSLLAGRIVGWVADNEYNMAVRWSATAGSFQTGYQDVTAGGDWVWSVDTAFDGAFAVGDFIQLFYANAFPHTLKDIKIWPTDEGTEFIEGAYP